MSGGGVGSSKALAGEKANQRAATLRKRRAGSRNKHHLPALEWVWQPGVT